MRHNWYDLFKSCNRDFQNSLLPKKLFFRSTRFKQVKIFKIKQRAQYCSYYFVNIDVSITYYNFTHFQSKVLYFIFVLLNAKLFGNK